MRIFEGISGGTLLTVHERFGDVVECRNPWASRCHYGQCLPRSKMRCSVEESACVLGLEEKERPSQSCVEDSI